MPTSYTQLEYKIENPAKIKSTSDFAGQIFKNPIQLIPICFTAFFIIAISIYFVIRKK